ncbi:erythromycin resistance leader peptide [TM7 phylum sp. oral taxon 352]|nr:erythromycin resistance leader peptide [TM7 phylum sp. oral taxon 352]TWP15782.1 erythromycin resistance leader peptide [TM7 phylum sp. oral taxon 352]TWP16379.1 erythromycin resistance leader peptide [TM7 phylum sp. oral taxon 352]TWP16987.1 erythromycin resistance leader peptide [TM7 phylum sp. oral taxon 352]
MRRSGTFYLSLRTN